MNFANDLNQLNQLLQDKSPWVPVALKPCALTLDSRRLDSPQSVWAALHEFMTQHQAIGWVETTQAVALLNHPDQAQGSPVLNAELAAGARSMHIRHLDDAWHCTVFTEAQGDSHWAAEKEVVSAETGASAFVYRTYSVVTAQGQFKETLARLVDVRRAAQGEQA